MTKQFTCPGCSQPSERAAVVAVGRFHGETHHYALCPKCAKKLQRNPQPLLDRVELALSQPKGAA